MHIAKSIFQVFLIMYLDLDRKSRCCLLPLKIKCFKGQDQLDAVFSLHSLLKLMPKIMIKRGELNQSILHYLQIK